MPTRRQRQTAKSPRRYLLWDTFPDPRAAGAINGTRAWPGPGVRTVVDTENKLSIANGVLTFAGGKAVPVYGDPGLWYSATLRVAGRTFLGEWNTTVINAGALLGFDTDQSSSLDAHSFRVTVGGFTLNNNAVFSSLVAAADQSTLYKHAIVLRVTGAYFFVKGGAFTTWTLLWIDATDNTATLYPGVSNYSNVLTADEPSISAVLWLPQPLVFDSFSRADGALGVSEYTGPDGQAAPVRTWTGATWTVSSNKAVNAPTLGVELVANSDMELDGNWANYGNVSTNEQSTVQKHGGVYARHYVTAGGYAGIKSDTFTLPAAASWVQCSAWYYPSATDSRFLTLRSSTAQLWGYGKQLTVATWTQLFVCTRIANGDAGSYFHSQAAVAGADDYIDDVSVKLLVFSTLFSSCGDLGTPDVLASADLVLTADTQAGVVTNLDSAASPANFLLACHNGTNALLDKCVGGTYTNLISVAATYAASATLRLITYTSGANLMADLFYNNVKIGTTQSVGDAGIKSNTICGLFSTYSLNTVDNWTCFARGSEGQYAALDSM